MSNNNKKLKQLSSILEKTKQDELTALLDDREKLDTDKTTLQKEVNSKKAKLQGLKNVYSHLRGAKKELDLLKTGAKAGFEAKGKKFLGDGSGNEWQTNGWNKKIVDHYPDNYTDNLYSVQGKSFSITEDEAVKLLAKVVYELEGIDKGKFSAKYTETDKSTLETTIDHVKEQGKAIKDLNDKVGADTGKKPTKKTYDLPQTYTKEQTGTTNTAWTVNPFQFADVFTLLEKLNNDSLISEIEDKTKITQNETWNLLKSGEAYTDEELADYGIKVADNAKTKLHKTSKEIQSIEIKNGLKGWLNLAKLVFAEEKNRNKLIASFTGSPNQQLFTDLRNQTTFKTHWELPETQEGVETLIDELEEEKNTGGLMNSQLKAEIEKQQEEIKAKETEITTKDNEIKTITDAIVVEKRKLVQTYNLSKGFDQVGAEDNRRSIHDLHKIQIVLSDIRYLLNGDTEEASGNSEEDTAYLTVKERIEKVDKLKCSLFYTYVSAEGNNQKAITKIKEEWKNLGGLDIFASDFGELDKLIQLSEKDKQALKDIQIAIGQKEDPTDTLEIYQTKLKEIDPLLTDTIITQTVIADWQTQNNFKTSEAMKAEIAKVFTNKALDAKFAELIKKEDAEITDLAKLFQKKEAKDIITLIRFWEYEKDTDKDKRKKLVWTLEKKDGNDKYLDDAELEEKEIKEILYQIAIGEKTLASVKKADETNGNDNTLNEEKGWIAWLNNNYWWPVWVPILLAIVGAVVFWDKISSWWNGPADEQGESEIAEGEAAEGHEEE